MFKNYFVKQAFLCVFSALILWFLLHVQGLENLENLSKPIWYTFLFINVLFAVLYFIGSESLNARSHKDFMTIFGVFFAVKVGVVLVWLLAALFMFGLKNTAYILIFFALYFSYTFLLSVHIFEQTKK